jgi:hypothetical protein
MKDAKGTPSYARQHKRGLTLPQQNAVDALATGKNDTETAELLKLNRVTVTKWRLYDPVFIAALNVRRAETWAAARHQLRALVAEALDVLAEEMRQPDPNRKMKAAVELLRVARPPSAAPDSIGPTDPEAVVRQIVNERRDKCQSEGSLLDDMDRVARGLPPFAQHMEQVWCELETLANGESDSDA